MENSNPIIEEIEIDMVEFAKVIWVNRKTIYKTVVIFIVLGLIVAFGSKVEYKASCKLLPDAQEGTMPSLGGLGGLAGLAGINLDMGSQGLSPDLYPQIVQSLPFQLQVINEKIRFEEKDTITTSYNYFKEIDSPSALGYIAEYTFGLPGKIKGLFSGESTGDTIQNDGKIIKISKEDSKLVEKFKERISVEVDSKTGMITLTAEMPDAVAAAELTKMSVDLLQLHVINYKISKTGENLKFVKERHKEAKLRFEKTQMSLAAFNDRNLNVITARAQSEQQRLQNEYNLAFEVYQSLAQQLENAEIKVKEDTPVFTMVEPVSIPVEKSKPKRGLIIIISLFLGIVTGITSIFVLRAYNILKSRF